MVPFCGLGCPDGVGGVWGPTEVRRVRVISATSRNASPTPGPVRYVSCFMSQPLSIRRELRSRLDSDLELLTLRIIG